MEKREKIIAIMRDVVNDSEENPDKSVAEVVQDLSGKLKGIYNDQEIKAWERQ